MKNAAGTHKKPKPNLSSYFSSWAIATLASLGFSPALARYTLARSPRYLPSADIGS
ncbi:hypothetical protein GXM_02629 [Nostoc sphaeroides CCNUC1]|uniref:Uncharacterized protein n=1 Tax=Nostoc sphaeroides CCNUC1 TaxID=2653204 RepID=A0A5P8VXL4_9NOSO|nr:hypothetical protein GXM_02629 [Nostoc sphaeroides CCNUC1]